MRPSPRPISHRKHAVSAYIRRSGFVYVDYQREISAPTLPPPPAGPRRRDPGLGSRSQPRSSHKGLLGGNATSTVAPSAVINDTPTVVGPTLIEGGRSKGAIIADISRSPQRSGEGCSRSDVKGGPDRPGLPKASQDRGQRSRGSTSHRLLHSLGLRLGRPSTRQPLGEPDGASGPLAKDDIISDHDIIMAGATELPPRTTGEGGRDGRDLSLDPVGGARLEAGAAHLRSSLHSPCAQTIARRSDGCSEASISSQRRSGNRSCSRL